MPVILGRQRRILTVVTLKVNHHRHLLWARSHWGDSNDKIVPSYKQHRIWEKILAFIASEVNNTEGRMCSMLPGHLQGYKLIFMLKINLVQCMHV